MDYEALAAIMQAADDDPLDVQAQIAAASANDSYGSEVDAMRYYDAAWSAGVPSGVRCRFMVGYGSTLRNNDRIDESIAVHQKAIEDYPDFPAHHAFLALALHVAGRHDEAIAAALSALLDAGRGNLDGYDRSLSRYRDWLSLGP